MNVPPDAISVEVEYRFGEYKFIVIEFLSLTQASTGAGRTHRAFAHRWLEKLALAIVLPPVFWIKKLRVGKCSFAFAAAGVWRSSRAGTIYRSWAQIATIHKLTAAYLFELNGGDAMPVPYRVFAPTERASLELLVSKKGGESGV